MTDTYLDAEVLPPLRKFDRRVVRGAPAIAAELYPGDPGGQRRIYCMIHDGTLPHWREGSLIVIDTFMVKLVRLLQQILSIQRRPFAPGQVVLSLPALALYLCDGEPTVKEIEEALFRVLENIKRARH